MLKVIIGSHLKLRNIRLTVFRESTVANTNSYSSVTLINNEEQRVIVNTSSELYRSDKMSP